LHLSGLNGDGINIRGIIFRVFIIYYPNSYKNIEFIVQYSYKLNKRKNSKDIYIPVVVKVIQIVVISRSKI